MRILPTWRHALFALSLLTLSRTALAAKEPDSAAKPEPANHGSHAARKHDRPASTAHAKAHPSARASQDARPSTTARTHASTAKPERSDAKAPTTAAHKSTVHGRTAAKTAKSGSGNASPRHGRAANKGGNHGAQHGHKPAAQPRPCLHTPVTFVRGFDNQTESVVLTQCNGHLVDGAVDRLSSWLSPQLAAKAESASTASAKGHHAHTSHPGSPTDVKHLDPGLVAKLQAVASHFPGKPIRIVSSYRPLSNRSYHQSGRAVDFVVQAVPNEQLVAFCRTLPDTGCGYYPNSSFVHMDIRAAGTGHVYWIDASKPGDPPRYVSEWPEKNDGSGSAGGALPPPDADAISDENSAHDNTAEPTSANSNKPAAAKPARGELFLDSQEEEKRR